MSEEDNDKFYKNKSFQKLQEKWYGKLKKEGFEDAEHDEDHLKLHHKYRFDAYCEEITYNAKESYYRLAGQFLGDHNFKTKTDKVIWDLHSQGFSYREIVKLARRHGIRTKKDKVLATVQRLVKLMVY